MNIKTKEKIWRDRGIPCTYDQYARLYTEQSGRCAICLEKPKTLRVDHDHATGVLRGLLCHNCNVGLGQFYDAPALLRRAAKYLGHYGHKTLNNGRDSTEEETE